MLQSSVGTTEDCHFQGVHQHRHQNAIGLAQAGEKCTDEQADQHPDTAVRAIAVLVADATMAVGQQAQQNESGGQHRFPLHDIQGR